MRRRGSPSVGYGRARVRFLMVVAVCTLVSAGFGGSATAEVPADWITVDSEHFKVAVPSRHRGDARRILEYAERAWDRMAQYLGTEPDHGATILLYV